MSKTALLIIDVQHGVFLRKEYDGMAVYQEEAFLKTLQQLIESARAKGVPVVYVQHMYENFPLMDKGQPLWNVHPALAPKPGEPIVEKHHADAFWDSTLQETLDSLGVERIVITGLQTAYCIDTTCRRAHSLGYETVLVADGHSTLDSDILPAAQIIAHHNEVLGSQFASVVKTQDLTL